MGTTKQPRGTAMGIEFHVRDEDDGVAFRRSCLPSIFSKRDHSSPSAGLPAFSPPRTHTMSKNQRGVEKKGRREGDYAFFDEQLVSVLSPVPKGYQEVNNNRPTPTTSASSMSLSPRTSSPTEWPHASTSVHSQQMENRRSEFSAVVSFGSRKDVEHLLTPPTPSDRSSRRRLQYEQDLRKRKKATSGTVGEVEPPGKWGDNILQPRMRSFPSTPTTIGDALPTVASTVPPRHQPPPSTRSGFTPPSMSRKATTTESSGAQPGAQSHMSNAVAHPTFMVPFPLASTPPPPPPPPPPPLPPSHDSQNSRASLGTTRALAPTRTDKRRESRPSSPELPYYISSSGSSDSNSTNSSFDVAVYNSEGLTSQTSLMENVDVLNNLAMDHIKQGEFENALSVFNHVLKIQQEKYGENHPANAGTYHNLGTVHAKKASAIASAAGESEQRHCRAQAVACFQAAARIARDSLGPTHPNVAVSLVRIGLMLLESRQYQNALITFKEALRLRMCVFGTQHRLVANVYNNMGLCCAQLGTFEEAKEYLDAAIGIQRIITKSEGASDQDFLELADTLFNLGGLNMEWIRQQGSSTTRSVEAESCFSEVLQIRRRILGSDSAMVVQVKTLLDIARSLPRAATMTRRRSSNPTIDSDSVPETSQSQAERSRRHSLSRDVESSPDISEPLASLGLSSKQNGDEERGFHRRREISRVTQRSGNLDRWNGSLDSSRTPDSARKEHLYSLLVSLVEQDREKGKP